MKNLVIFLILFPFSSTGLAATYGKGASGKTSHEISDLTSAPKSLSGTFVRVSGKVKEVCPMKGCWMELEDIKTGMTIKVKVKDDVIVFPKDAVGKTALVQGRLKSRHLSKSQAIRYYAHLAEEKGQKFDSSTVKGPVIFYEIKAEGAEIN